MPKKLFWILTLLTRSLLFPLRVTQSLTLIPGRKFLKTPLDLTPP